MKALPLEQRQLLDLQRLDLDIAKIRHTQKSHPSLQTLEALRNRQGDLQGAVVAARADLDDVNRQIAAVEAETEKVRTRRELQQTRLDEGKVPMRDMSAMEHEIRNMTERIGTLEAESMELMEQAERIEAMITAALANAEAIGADESAARTQMEADLAVSNKELERLGEQRQQLVAKIPADLVDEYETLRTRLGSVVVIEVRDGRPVASPVEFSAVDLSRLGATPTDEVFIHEDSEMLVVRTSGE